MLFAAGILLIGFVMMVGRNYATRSDHRNEGLIDATKQIKQTLSDNIENIDSEKVTKAIDDLKERSKNGELDSATKVRDAVKETGREMGIEITDDAAGAISDAVDQLEDMGFSTETLIEETEEVYKKYGEDFLDHMEEAFIEASKEAAGNTAEQIWDSVEDTVRQMF